MRMFDLLSLMNPDIYPEDMKLHLATPGRDNQEPIDVYRAGGFQDWQCWQTQKNFERPFVISLISLLPRQKDRWLFAGVYQSQGSEPKYHPRLDREYYYYDLIEEPAYCEMDGRLVVTFTRPGRYPYINAEKYVDSIVLSEIYATRLTQNQFS